MNARDWVVGIVLAAHALGAPRAEITVQVYNAARAPELEVRKALGQAGWLLAQAGIKTHWLDCADLPGCQPRTETGLFVVSILSEDPRGPGSAHALGFAVLAGRRSGAAVVYPHIVSKLKDNPQYADCNVLGHVIAHELGHLLLRSPRHGAGLMKADWNLGDFAAMRQKRLKFSAAEAQKLGSRVPSQIASAKIPAVGSD